MFPLVLIMSKDEQVKYTISKLSAPFDWAQGERLLLEPLRAIPRIFVPLPFNRTNSLLSHNTQSLLQELIYVNR